MGGLVAIALATALGYWLMWRAGRKSRRTPKVPRDRRRDTRVFWLFG